MILPSVESLCSSLQDEVYFVDEGAAGGLWRHQTWSSSWILSRIRNQVKTVRINAFLRLTCEITLHHFIHRLFFYSWKKLKNFTHKWPDYLLLMTSYLWPSHHLPPPSPQCVRPRVNTRLLLSRLHNQRYQSKIPIPLAWEYSVGRSEKWQIYPLLSRALRWKDIDAFHSRSYSGTCFLVELERTVFWFRGPREMTVLGSQYASFRKNSTPCTEWTTVRECSCIAVKKNINIVQIFRSNISGLCAVSSTTWAGMNVMTSCLLVTYNPFY